jgi:hypothetical protein
LYSLHVLARTFNNETRRLRALPAQRQERWREMTKQQTAKLTAKAVDALKAQQLGFDPEGEHAHADDILCELLTALGYTEVVAEYKKIRKWYA